MQQAVSRNAPCPCGSGKRFKDCHGALGESPAAPGTADDLLREAQFEVTGGRPAAAHVVLRRAHDLAPGRADILREQARIELMLNDPNAAATCRAALALAPGDLAARNLLGQILSATDPGAAEAQWREVLAVDSDDPEALFHLGNRHRERGEHATAIECYERALKRAPGHVGVLNNLGLAFESIGNRDRAEACYRSVLDAQPKHADALANLANLLQAQGRSREAVMLYDKALAVRRDFPASFWISRGAALSELGELSVAEESFREAARQYPDHLGIQINISSICISQGNFEAAEAPLVRVAELDPDNAYAAAMLAYCSMHRCEWAGLDDSLARVRAFLADETQRGLCNIAPFPLLAMPLGPADELAAAKRWARQIAEQAGPDRLPERVATRPPGARLRVGFVSSDFRDHPVSHLLVDCWERIDRSRLEMFGYGLMPEDMSPFGQRVVRAFEHFTDLSARPAANIAGRIRDDAIDVLVDLNGYTSFAKSEAFVLKPAPVQLSWLGYLGTLGAECYDYVLTDRFVSPPESQAFFTERFLYLPDCYCPSDLQKRVGVVPDRAACGLPETGLVFCCFNNAYKILPSVFAVWMRLLEAVPRSVLWLAPTSDSAWGNLQREARERGIDPARVVFAPRVGVPEYLARYAHADLFLDTFPYNAGTTANDALFMGVPVLTCAGETMVSRVAGSQLHAVGLPELVTANLAQYEALARDLARTPERLARCRERLRANRASHPLFDMDRFARGLEDALERAWADQASRMSSA